MNGVAGPEVEEFDTCLGEDATKFDSVWKSLFDHTCRRVENLLIRQ